MKPVQKEHTDFKDFVNLLRKARSRAYAEVNAELVLVYFILERIVSEKVHVGEWRDKAVDSFISFIEKNIYNIKGLNRRGLFGMIQFYEKYSPISVCFLLWIVAQNKKVMPTSIKFTLLKKKVKQFVLPLAEQLQQHDNQYSKFTSTVLTQITRSLHLKILSSVRTTGKQLFYLMEYIRERWSKLELRRQIKSVFFEWSKMSNKLVFATNPIISSYTFNTPYISQFLYIPKIYLEKNLLKDIEVMEYAIARKFLLLQLPSTKPN